MNHKHEINNVLRIVMILLTLATFPGIFNFPYEATCEASRTKNIYHLTWNATIHDSFTISCPSDLVCYGYQPSERQIQTDAGFAGSATIEEIQSYPWKRVFNFSATGYFNKYYEEHQTRVIHFPEGLIPQWYYDSYDTYISNITEAGKNEVLNRLESFSYNVSSDGSVIISPRFDGMMMGPWIDTSGTHTWDYYTTYVPDYGEDDTHYSDSTDWSADLRDYIIGKPGNIESDVEKEVYSKQISVPTNYIYNPYGDNHYGVANWQITVAVEKVELPEIESVEFTQAIQVYQSIDDLKNTLSTNSNKPPVPIVSWKPLAIRVYPEKVDKLTQVTIEAFWNGVKLGSKPMKLSPLCSPEDRRARKNIGTTTCRSADFLIPSPEEGLASVSVIMKQGELTADDHYVSLDTKRSDELLMGVVNVCADLTAGNWDCLPTPVRDLERGVDLMRKIYPTDTVTVQPTGHQVRLDIVPNMNGDLDRADCYDQHWNITFNGHYDASGRLIIDFIDRGAPIVRCEEDMWWANAALRINRLFTIADYALEPLFGIQKYYHGLAISQPEHSAWGMAHDIPSRGALSLTIGPDVTIRDMKETVAHETAHMLGRKHTDLSMPCGNRAWDPSTDWPFDNNQIQSCKVGLVGGKCPSSQTQLEVGFDVVAVPNKRVVKPIGNTFDVMSYCSPYWITPFTYTKLLDIVDPPPPQPAGVQGTFWLVSGFIDDSGASFEPIFTFETIGRVEPGDGTHIIVVLDDNSNVLYWRFFTPTAAEPRIMPGGTHKIGRPSFSELIPVHESAAMIVVTDSEEAVIGVQPLGGMAPDVSITFPAGGELLGGNHLVEWNVIDPDADNTGMTYWMQYSPDGGTTWLTLAQALPEPQLMVDFDNLPGSNGNALIRILASDGVNTGTATSSPFSVPKKLPSAEILFPEDGSELLLGDPVFLKGYGLDMDDGMIEDTLLRWESNVDGFHGNGKGISFTPSAEGEHVISLIATDSDGNQATDSITVIVEDKPLVEEVVPLDSDEDGFNAADDCDDGDPAVNPGATEIPYNGKDDDCDQTTRDDDIDNDGYVISEDCDDGNPFVSPGAVEVMDDGIDNDCNPETPDSSLDIDNDGDGYTENQGDCDDWDADVKPGATEVPYNGKDDDCSASTPDDDLDGDGYVNAEDCDDKDASNFPGNPEICDGKDNNCDDQVDEGCATNPSDLDHDGDVDGDDYNSFLTAFGKCTGQDGYNVECDYDKDNCITFVDYQMWYAYYMNQ